MTGKPTTENWNEEVKLKFVASDGYFTSEDTLIIKASKVEFLTIFFEIMKGIGPLITVCFMGYRYRVKIHNIVYFNRFNYGKEVITTNTFF